MHQRPATSSPARPTTPRSARSRSGQEAKLRKDELTDLLGGSSPFGGKQAEAKAPWKDVCGRSPLMQHLENIWEPRLKPALADKGQFTANADKVLRDAEMITAIGHVLAKDGMADADSEEYVKFCNALRDGAQGDRRRR